MTNQTNLVSIDNNKLITTSNKVAETFKKRHDHIVRDINVLAAKINAPKFGEMFSETSYMDKKGETRPCYRINRDGFTLLAMGFTGKKALEFKLKYIEAFNLMEAKLKELSNKPDFTTTLTTVKQHTRKLPTVRVKKELTLPKDVYKNIGGVVKVVVKSEMDKYMKILIQPKLDFNQMDLPEAQKANLTIFKDLNKMIAEYGKACEVIGNMQGIVALKKMLPERLYNEVSKCISQKSI